MTNRDIEYFRMREQQERDSADRSEDDIARRVHLEMADRYAELHGTMPEIAAGALVKDIPAAAIPLQQA